MTDNYELVGSIRRSLHSIRDHYDMALIPAKLTSGVKLPTQAAEGVKIKYAKKVMEHSPAPTDLGVVQERIDTHSDLSHYCRVILFEVTDINGDTIQTKLNPADPIMLTWFIDTWADRMAEQVPLEAQRAEKELSKHAHRLKSMAYPERQSSVLLGECPVTVAVDGDSVPCGSKVRAFPDEDDRHRFVKCPKCGTEDTVEWWMSQILPEGSDLTHLDAVIACVALRTGEILTHGQVRMWAQRGRIRRHGRDLKGRTLYSAAAVLAWVADGVEEVAA